MDFQTQVKMEIYGTIARTTRIPDADAVARSLDSPSERVSAAYQALAEQRLLVFDREDSRRIRMAPPFSGVETQFRVEIEGQTFFANCAWDAYGVAAALDKDATITSRCGDCGQPIELSVRSGWPRSANCIAHFAVPAAHWWDDIVHT